MSFSTCLSNLEVNKGLNAPCPHPCREYVSTREAAVKTYKVILTTNVDRGKQVAGCRRGALTGAQSKAEEIQ
jgi:hypothetical protein